METTYVYEIKSEKYPDKYIGIIKNPDFEHFINLQEYFRDQPLVDDKGYKIEKLLVQSNLSKFIEHHGGWDLWDFEILKICKTREEAQVEKELRLMRGAYTINVYGTNRKRAKRQKK
jgi:hypothetical protein